MSSSNENREGLLEPPQGGTTPSTEHGRSAPEESNVPGAYVDTGAGATTSTGQTSGGTGMAMDISQIQHGWDVFGSDGEKVGDVSEVGSNYVLVKKGFIFTKDRYIPTSAITGIEHDRVYLNVTKDQADTMGWDQPPADATGYAAATTTTQTTDTDYTMTDRTEDQGMEYAGATEEPSRTETTETDTVRVPRYEEELQAQTTEREAGTVQVTKDVTEEERTLEVPVTREEVHVETHPVDEAATDTSQAFQGGTIEVPVREEQVETRKEPRVAEELEIEKTAVQDTETVSDTVRREDVRVEQQGDTSYSSQESSERMH